MVPGHAEAAEQLAAREIRGYKGTANAIPPITNVALSPITAKVAVLKHC